MSPPGLLALGIGRGDRVGIWAPNRAEWLYVQFGTARIGAILVNINPAYQTLGARLRAQQGRMQGAGDGARRTDRATMSPCFARWRRKSMTAGETVCAPAQAAAAAACRRARRRARAGRLPCDFADLWFALPVPAIAARLEALARGARS